MSYNVLDHIHYHYIFNQPAHACKLHKDVALTLISMNTLNATLTQLEAAPQTFGGTEQAALKRCLFTKRTLFKINI